jgi:putative membrane protein
MEKRGATQGASGGSLSSNDRQFVMMAAHGGWAEIEAGELAQKNAASEAVRKFGQRMVQDHRLANKELETIASKMGITPPKEPDAKHKADAKMLASLKGPEFDSKYSSHMVMDHEMTVALFEKQAKSGDDSALKAFAAKQLPILQEHLKMARALPGAK